jgi:uncharacterized repeat protein (TIGR03803 family)
MVFTNLVKVRLSPKEYGMLSQRSYFGTTSGSVMAAWHGRLSAILLFLALILAGTSDAWAGNEKVLHSFLGYPDGNDPYASVISMNGNMYGTTFYGGQHLAGAVYELRRTKAGWSEDVLHSFKRGTGDGNYPRTPLATDMSGNLFGTTFEGGSGEGGDACSYGGCGTIFELSPSKTGWKEKVLYNFCSLSGCTDGNSPSSGLIWDGTSSFYGTTQSGGTYYGGTVFRISNSSGVWVLQTIYSFPYADSPENGVVRDSSGNLYGTTRSGGINDAAIVYELSPNDASWTFTTICPLVHDSSPPSGLIIDSAGNLYGTVPTGGAFGYGEVYELTYTNSSWVYNVLYSFTDSEDGWALIGPVTLDQSGNLYGTTQYGGSSDQGTVFKLTPSKPLWTHTILFDFSGANGSMPVSGLMWTEKGSLIGTTVNGGKINHGTVYELTP